MAKHGLLENNSEMIISGWISTFLTQHSKTFHMIWKSKEISQWPFYTGVAMVMVRRGTERGEAAGEGVCRERR